MSKRKTLRSVLDSKTDRLNKLISKAEAQFAAYEELVMIRQRATTGKLTGDLYTFLNQDGSLEQLFQYLPKQSAVPESSLEDLQVAQMYQIDIAIEGLMSSIKDTLLRIWHAFLDWIDSWFDHNRRIKFRLQRHLRELENNPLKYGTPAVYDTAYGVVYACKTEWQKMFNAVVDLSALLKTVPQNEPGKFFKDNETRLARDLAEFGYDMTDGSIVRDAPRYDKQERKIGQSSAGWLLPELATHVRKSIDLLGNEAESRKEFISVQRAFDRAISSFSEEIDKAAFSRLIRVCKVTKESAGVVARAVCDVCNIALRFA